MMYPFNKDLISRFEISEADKPELVELIKEIYFHANTVRHNGSMIFLVRQEELDRIEDKLLRLGLRMIGDGAFDEVQFEEVLTALLMSEAPKGKALIRQLIVSEGLLSIRKGQSPSTSLLLMSAFLGLPGVTELTEWEEAQA